MKSNQIKSTEAIKYLWKIWTWSGVYPTEKYNFLQYLHGGFFLLGMNLGWALSLIVNRIHVQSFEEFLDNVPMDLTAIGCFLKFGVALKMHRHLKHVSELIDDLDGRVLNLEHKQRITKFIKLCHGLFMLFAGGYFCSDTTNLLGTLIFRRGKLFHETWFPFDTDIHKSVFNYGCALIYQYLMILILGTLVAVFDVCVPTYLIVLTAHLEFLMERTANINKDEKLSNEENYEELVACIKDHRSIMRIFNILQNTIAYAIFFQFVTTSLVIVSQTVDFLIYNPSQAQLAYKAFFVGAVILQILPCCYYSNQFMDVSDKFVTSIYSCNWLNQNQKFKKGMIIFMLMTQEKKVLVAGKIVPITLATFVSIMKLTYSLVTLALNIQK